MKKYTSLYFPKKLEQVVRDKIDSEIENETFSSYVIELIRRDVGLETLQTRIEKLEKDVGEIKKKIGVKELNKWG